MFSRIWPGSSGRNGRKSDAAGHAEHVPEVGARRRQDVLHRVRERLAAFLDAAPDHVEAAFEQHEIGGFFRDVDRLFHREARIGRVHRRRIVDAVAEKSDDVPHLLRGKDDPFLLIGIDLDEQIRLFDRVPERGVVQRSRARGRRAGDSDRSPTSPATCRATRRLSPVMTLTDTPSAARLAIASRTPSLGMSRNVTKPSNTMSRSSSRE